MQEHFGVGIRVGRRNQMKSMKLMCVFAMTGFALLVMPLGLAAPQQQENQQQQPRLTFTDNSESFYSTTTSVTPQDRIDGGPTGRFQSSTTTDGTVDYLKEQLEPQAFTGQTTNQCLREWAHCFPRFPNPCCRPLQCVCLGSNCWLTNFYCVPW